MHPGLLRASGWRYSGRLRDILAARWAGVLAGFDGMTRNQRLDVVAAYEIAWRMDAVNAYEATRKN